MNTQTDKTQQETPKEMTLQEYIDYVSLQEWKVRELKAALDMYKYDKELKELKALLTQNK